VPSDGRDEHSVAMWGAPTSGKTTYLAALSIALAQQDDAWKLVGADGASTEALVKLTMTISRDRAFPPATKGIEHYRWLLMGQTESVVRRRWLGTRRQQVPVKIGLHLVDASGEIAGPDSPASRRNDLVENLEQSRGIVFLFDPIREFTKGDAFDYTFSVLSELATRMVDSPDFAGGCLPHYIAICVTKFDEIRVLRTAQDMALLEYDPGDEYGFPRVDNDYARDLFARLCHVSKSGNAELVMRNLERYFLPERIKYFVTSSIGFHVDPHSGSFNPDNYQNQYQDQPPDEPEQQQRARIRGSVHPINVVEPMLWLASQLVKLGAPGGAGKVMRP
jgi:hypothetical protein